MKVTKDKRPHAQIALSGTLSAKEVEKFWDKALAAIIKEVALPGFRKGHVPRERVLQEVGEKSIWREAAEMALNDSLEEILKKEDVHPIVPLSLSMKSADKGADVEFEITATVAPSVTLGDARAIAKKALAAMPADDTAKERAEARKAFEAQLAGMMQKEEGVAITDEDAKTVGFESAAALNLFIDEQSAHAVADRAMQKRRGAVADALIAEAAADIPLVFIHDEAAALLDATKKDIAARGTSWNDYLKHFKKTDEQVLEDLKPQAEKRIALDLIFSEIIKNEELKLEGEDAKKAEDELAHRIAHQGVEHQTAHTYARESLLREKVWEVLGVKPETKGATS